jgi:hypothetical protein
MNPHRKILAFILVCLSLALGTAVAQVEPEAAEWLERAREAHGGEALASVESLRETVLITFFGPDGQPAAEFTGVATVDFTGNRLRIELYDGDDLLLIQQVTPERNAAWSQESGTINLPAAQARELIDTLATSYYGLRLGGEGREAAQVVGEATFGEVTGQAVEVTTGGKTTTYLLAGDGTMLAERYFSPTLNAEATTLYEDLRAADGLILPFASHQFIGDAPFVSSETQEVEVNAELTDDDFELP